jgi:glycosyltransferase involved in cell wall biosynthesis
VAPYLERCLASIRAQSWQALEVWLVNDGSTDNSLALCRAAEAADPRFHVIDKPNSGVSDSRNAALDRATGKFIQFVDGDDYLAPNATETLVRAAESAGADLVIAHFYRARPGRATSGGSGFSPAGSSRRR